MSDIESYSWKVCTIRVTHSWVTFLGCQSLPSKHLVPEGRWCQQKHVPEKRFFARRNTAPLEY